MKFTIAKKLTLLVTLVVVITASVLGVSVNKEYDELLTQQEIEKMGENTSKETTRILTIIEHMKEDVVFLSETPPIQGIIRALKNNNIDRLDGSTAEVWKKRLETIFESFLSAKPHYLKARYIGVNDEGKELVKVDKIKGVLTTYAGNDMQSKSHRPYFKKGITLNKNTVFLSDVNYNREHGQITEPLVAVMRAVTPVYDGGKLYGMVILTLDVSHMFSAYLSFEGKADSRVTRYITTSNGDFLRMQSKSQAFMLDSIGLIGDLPKANGWDDFISVLERVKITEKIISSDGNIALHARKIFFDESNEKRFIVLAEKKPYEQVVAKASHVKKYSLLLASLLLIPAILITVLFSFRFTQPLKEITKALSGFRKNRGSFKLDVSANDEFGTLANSLRDMVNELNKAQEQLIQSEKMASIGQLAAGVAHEINNPVGFIGSNIYTLKTYCDDLLTVISEYEKADGYLSKNTEECTSIEKLKNKIDLPFLKQDLANLINESTDGVKRVKDIVQDLKDFSHLGEVEWQYSDIHEGLDSTLNIVNNEIKYKADVIKVYGEIPEVECIASQINQVFMNLLVNAAHSIDEHGTITVETGLTDNDWVWISISDTGKGIPKATMKNIFDPFFTTKPIGQGTGLGLSLSYGIIEKHSGRIDVESVEGVGTKFSIWLPVNQPDKASVE